MASACLTEKFFSILRAIKHGEYYDKNFVCAYAFDARYFWGFFALLALVFLVDARNRIKHGVYHPLVRSGPFWPFFIILFIDFLDQTFDLGGRKESNICIFLSQVPGVDCGQVLGVLLTYAILSAAMSYYITLYDIPDVHTNYPQSYEYGYLHAKVSYSLQDKSTQTEDIWTRAGWRRTDDTPTGGFEGSYRSNWRLPIPEDAVIGASGNPRDWWKPSPAERDLLYQTQSGLGSSSETEAPRDSIETVDGMKSGSKKVHASEADAPSIKENEVLGTSSNTTPELPTFNTPISATRSGFTCCNQLFRTRAEYNRHERYHKRPVGCPRCPLRFGTTTDLDRHINDVHERTSVWHCAEVACKHSRTSSGRGFSRKDNWRRHMRNAHGVNVERDATI
ncbi:uncharacterized protein LY89DRAFT_718232 [Mollisia scopiformis]|uniref:C2H2-type domain-containing protein n=1 Tax=Mollisia scopiformis TaxID=149040 RepID=A0A194XBL8_MOLSC|nr:uncharacterized protein LY89DRAFT_718232 [Mollisia scopiformis]KUJ17554.1 hypothetical protein LY89DRAFT_718232 [Mollisia scopiformis]